jgi:hypothetical protein
MLSAKSQEILLERERGAPQAELAERHDVTQQRVAAIIRDATELVTKIELDLVVARKKGEVGAFVVPYGPDYELAMAFGAWLVHRLRDRDLDIRVTTRRAPNGLALLLEDVTDYSRGGENR